jgi:tRNA(Ile2)-agmatinylcytidine synthase
MDNEVGRLSFNNIDPETGRILITPRGPDPILYGIRGESSEVVRRGHELVLSKEPVERWVIFRTNQGTDAHLKRDVSISEVEPFSPCVTRGEVIRKPTVIQGGHVIFKIKDDTGQIDCAAYKPTGRLRDVAKMLIAGDFIEAYGGVRPPSSRNPVTVNLEKIRIIDLAPFFVITNPLCPVCGKRTKSAGKGQGFKCKKCDFQGPNLKKTVLGTDRSIEPGVYVTSPRSQRHLTKPLKRYGSEKPVSFQNSDKIVPYELFSGP